MFKQGQLHISRWYHGGWYVFNKGWLPQITPLEGLRAHSGNQLSDSAWLPDVAGVDMLGWVKGHWNRRKRVRVGHFCSLLLLRAMVKNKKGFSPVQHSVGHFVLVAMLLGVVLSTDHAVMRSVSASLLLLPSLTSCINASHVG